MSPTGYSRIQITLHWLMLVLLAANWLLAEPMEQAWRTVEQGGTPATTPWLHILIGIAVLAFGLWRLVLRLTRGVPADSQAAPPWMRLAGRLGHGLLYLLMLGTPLLGLAAWYGGIEWAADLHGLAVNLLLLVVAVHATAALFHQLVLKDGLIGRMLKAS